MMKHRGTILEIPEIKIVRRIVARTLPDREKLEI